MYGAFGALDFACSADEALFSFDWHRFLVLYLIHSYGAGVYA